MIIAQPRTPISFDHVYTIGEEGDSETIPIPLRRPGGITAGIAVALAASARQHPRLRIRLAPITRPSPPAEATGDWVPSAWYELTSPLALLSAGLKAGQHLILRAEGRYHDQFPGLGQVAAVLLDAVAYTADPRQWEASDGRWYGTFAQTLATRRQKLGASLAEIVARIAIHGQSVTASDLALLEYGRIEASSATAIAPYAEALGVSRQQVDDALLTDGVVHWGGTPLSDLSEWAYAAAMSSDPLSSLARIEADFLRVGGSANSISGYGIMAFYQSKTFQLPLRIEAACAAQDTVAELNIIADAITRHHRRNPVFSGGPFIKVLGFRYHRPDGAVWLIDRTGAQVDALT